MATPKVYEYEVIEETPFPTEDAQPIVLAPTTGTASVRTPTTTKEKTFSKKRVAIELLSTALNTRSKKVLQSFELAQSGGFQIGDFKQGISGDLRITPNGLTARDIAGLTTFTIDGTTGDAIFKGLVRSGSLISGIITVGGEGNGDGYISVLDETRTERVLIDSAGVYIFDGKVTIENSDGAASFDASGLISTTNVTSGNTNASPTTAFTTATYVDISGSSMTFTLARSARVLILLTVHSSQAQTNATLDMSGRVFYTVDLNGSDQNPDIVIDAIYNEVDGDRDNVIRSTYTTTMLKTFPSGSNTIKAKYKIDTAVNITATLHKWDLTYILLGT